MKDLLFEIGTEELPARFMPGALRDLAASAARALQEAGLAYASVKTLGTPRRLALLVDGLRWARRRGAREAVVNTDRTNIAARSLYESFGFVNLPTGLVVLEHAR